MFTVRGGVTDRGDREFRPSNLPFSWGTNRGLRLIQCYLGPHKCPAKWHLISLRPTASAGCKSVTDIHTDRRTDRRTTRGYICRNRWNRWCDADHLKNRNDARRSKLQNYKIAVSTYYCEVTDEKCSLDTYVALYTGSSDNYRIRHKIRRR